LAEGGIPWPKDEEMRSGSGDWPEAYRYMSMHPEGSRACGVVWWHSNGGKLVFQGHHELLWFAQCSHVFQQMVKFAQALVRGVLMPLFAMYFDMLPCRTREVRHSTLKHV